MEMSIPVLRRRSNCGAGEKISNAGTHGAIGVVHAETEGAGESAFG